jgi:hypothetical protein
VKERCMRSAESEQPSGVLLGSYFLHHLARIWICRTALHYSNLIPPPTMNQSNDRLAFVDVLVLAPARYLVHGPRYSTRTLNSHK